MKKFAVPALILALVLICGCAMAEQRITLPGERLTLRLPDEMTFSSAGRSELEEFRFAYFTKTLEMDVFAYPSGGKSLAEMGDMVRNSGV